MIPMTSILVLAGILLIVAVLSFFFSWASSQGIRFQSCRGDGSCGCEGHGHGKTAERILSLINDKKE